MTPSPRHPAPGPDSDDALALDLVLGILRPPLLAMAQARAATDAGFAARVTGHVARLQLSPDAPTLPIEPRAETWHAIAARLAKPRD
jgi:anti-sigma-K factor RskA